MGWTDSLFLLLPRQAMSRKRRRIQTPTASLARLLSSCEEQERNAGQRPHDERQQGSTKSWSPLIHPLMRRTERTTRSTRMRTTTLMKMRGRLNREYRQRPSEAPSRVDVKCLPSLVCRVRPSETQSLVQPGSSQEHPRSPLKALQAQRPVQQHRGRRRQKKTRPRKRGQAKRERTSRQKPRPSRKRNQARQLKSSMKPDQRTIRRQMRRRSVE